MPTLPPLSILTLSALFVPRLKKLFSRVQRYKAPVEPSCKVAPSELVVPLFELCKNRPDVDEPYISNAIVVSPAGAIAPILTFPAFVILILSTHALDV